MIDPRDAQTATLLLAIELSGNADEHYAFWKRLMTDLRLFPGHFPAVVRVIARREFLNKSHPFAFVRSASRGEAVRLGLADRKRKPTTFCLGEAPAPTAQFGKEGERLSDPLGMAQDRHASAEWHRYRALSDHKSVIDIGWPEIDWAEVLIRAGVTSDVGEYIIDRLHGEQEKPTEAVRKAFQRAKPALKAAIDMQRRRSDPVAVKHVPKAYHQIAA